VHRSPRQPAPGFAHRRSLRPWCCALLALGVSACAQQRPVLYPNAHYERVGRVVADAEIDACMQLAASHVGNTSPAEQTAKSTGIGAAIGSAIGAAVGAVHGRPGTGAAAGAAGGGTGGLARGILRSGRNDPVFQRYVGRCLHDRGFETIGWR
jgi:uncharacterized protein YcfJ